MARPCDGRLHTYGGPRRRPALAFSTAGSVDNIHTHAHTHRDRERDIYIYGPVLRLSTPPMGWGGREGGGPLPATGGVRGKISYGGVYLSIYLSVCLSICLSIYLSVCLSIYPPVYLRKRSTSARLPHFSTLTTAKTKQFYETSAVFELDNLQNEAILRDFLNV